MDPVTYSKQLKELLQPIPVEFHDYIEASAYDRGHSAGREEVLLLVTEIIGGLLPCIKSYRTRLTDTDIAALEAYN